MIFAHDYWWPFSARKCSIRDCRAIGPFSEAGNWSGGVVVQAGGNVGIYPIKLAEIFDKVYTFELEPKNFACLEWNIDDRGLWSKIEARNAALGSEPGKVGIHYHKACGGHYVDPDGDEIEVTTIDALKLKRCDLIWLDIEGYETKALEGAYATIGKHKPQIILEDWEPYYGRYDGDLAKDWLVKQFGYKPKLTIKADTLFLCDM